MSEIAVRDAAAIVKPIPVPRQLQELGIRFGADEAGTRVVYLPNEVRQACNVINPVTSYVQADPNWTPGISLVTIDVERDTYPLPGGKRGLSKQALETLSRAAGVLYTRTSRVPRDELQPGETYAYRATVGLRRSDGTVDEVTRERGFNETVARAEVEANGGNVEKNWLQLLKFGPAMTESKAINRALRAALSVPTSLTAADAAKPFLVIGYNFTPDYDDPEVKRALVAIGFNAQAAIYGGREISEDLPELPAGDIPGEVLAPPEPGVGGDLGTDAVSAAADSEQAGGAVTIPPADPVGRSSDPEPELTFGVPASAVDAAASTVVESQGKTIGEILTLDGADKWVGWALRNLPEQERAALELVVQNRRPDLIGG